MKERTQLEEDANTIFRANTTLSQIKNWVSDGLIKPEKAEMLKEKPREELKEGAKSLGVNITLQILFGGGITIFIIACFLLMTWVDATEFLLIFFFYFMGVACIGCYGVLYYLKKLDILAIALAVAGLIFIGVGFGLSDQEWPGDRWEVMVGALGLAAVMYSYYRNSIAIMIASHIMFLMGLFLTMDVLGVSNDTGAIFIFVLYSCLLLASVGYIEFAKVRDMLPGSIPDRSLMVHLAMPMFMIFILTAMFELPVYLEPELYQYFFLLLYISAGLLTWGLYRNQHLVAITGIVFIIIACFYFGVEQGEIEIAGTLIFIIAAVMLGYGIGAAFFNWKTPCKETEWLGIYLYVDPKNKRVLHYLEDWKTLLGNKTYEQLSKIYNVKERVWPGTSLTFTRTALILGGSGVTVVGFILLLVFLDLTTLSFAIVFTIASVLCFLVYAILEYFKKLKPLAVGLFGVGEILLFIAILRYYDYFEVGITNSQETIFATIFLLIPLVSLGIAFWRKSYFITLISFPFLMFCIPFVLNGLMHFEFNTLGIVFLLIFIPILGLHLVLQWYSKANPEAGISKIVESYKYFGHLLHPFFILYIVILFFFLDNIVDFVWDKSIMMLVLSVPLLIWGLKRRLYPLAISAMLILIFDAWFFGVGIAEICGAVIALMISALILVGVGVFIAVRFAKGRKEKKEQMAIPKKDVPKDTMTTPEGFAPPEDEEE